MKIDFTKGFKFIAKNELYFIYGQEVEIVTYFTEQLEAIEENFIKLIEYYINRDLDQENKLFLIQILRDIKIKNLLDK